jgi:Heparinase II/III-like protein/Heparinase II/III N-terminus
MRAAAPTLPLRATRVVPRPVYCATAHKHRSRSVAEAVYAGRFEHFGTTLDLGPEPDWTGVELPPDEEWRIAWSKFYEGLDLGHAFAETGEQRFLHAWERLVSSWIRRVPVGWDTSDVAARRLQNWIYAWQRFADSPAYSGLSRGLDEEIVRSVAEQAAYIRANLSAARNHRTLELYTLFLVPLALPETDPGGNLLAEAIRGLHENLRADVLPDGVHCECSTHYHLLVLRTFLGARENARRFGLRFPEGFDEQLERACEFALHCHRPDGRIPALSDSDTGSYAELLELAASLLGRPDFLYAASSGARGLPPGRRYASFPAGGYFFQRSGWGTDGVPFAEERFLVFDCGPLGAGGHGHYDLLSIEAAAGGRPLLVDPGRFTYAEERSPNWRRWFKGTAAHNTVCIDRLDQTTYRRRAPKGRVAEGRFLGRLSAPGLDVLHGKARSPCYDAVHARRVVFVGDEYWLVEDRLRAAGPHRYDLRFHLAPEAWNATEIAHDGRAAVVRAPGLAIVVPGDVRPTLEEGWYAPEYGRKLQAPVVSIAVEDVPSTTFLSLVVPLDAEQPVPDVRVRSTDDPVAVEVASPTRRDVVAWSRTRAGWWRTSADREPLSFRLCGTGADWLAWDRGGSLRRGSSTP